MTRLARLVLAPIIALCAARALAAPAPGAVVRVEHLDATRLPALGPADAPVTIELFFIPGQPWRQPQFHLLENLQAQHPSQIRLVYRVIVGNGVARLPYAALEAFAQGKFFELVGKLNCAGVPPSACKQRTNYTTKEIRDLGAEIGMDTDALEAAMSNPPKAYRDTLEDNSRRLRLRVRGSATPAVLFSGRASHTPLTSMSPGDLEHEYEDAKARADDLIDRGANAHALAEALDALADGVSDPVVQVGGTDYDFDQPPGPHTLAAPPLAWDGLPSWGDARAPVTIAILCAPQTPLCDSPKRAALLTQADYPDKVRVVWAPFFDLRGDDATTLATLGDAALCAERVGARSDSDSDLDQPKSAGWLWIEGVMPHLSERHRGTSVEPILDALVAKLHVDHAAFAACRARMAGTTVAWIERARKSGVHTSPATIIGGRIYPPIIDKDTVQQLVTAELAPGVLHEAVYWLGGLATVRASRE